jgi:hypothetical protein
VTNNRTPAHLKRKSENAIKRYSNPTTPNRRYNIFEPLDNSARSDRTVDTYGYQGVDTAAGWDFSFRAYRWTLLEILEKDKDGNIDFAIGTTLDLGIQKCSANQTHPPQPIHDTI